MDIGPIFRALLRNKLGVVLIAAQIAFTLTVMVNAIYIISDRGRLMAIPSGMDDANLFHLTSIGFGENFNEADVVFNDLAMLRQTPGIVNATITNSIPVSSSGSSSGFTTEAGRRESTVGSAMYYVDEQALDTMGLELIAGRDFSASDMSLRNSGDTHFPDNIIVSLAFAEALFPGEGAQAAGRSIYTARDQPLRITGIVRQLQAPWPQSPVAEHSMLLPMNTLDGTTTYLIRTEPGQRDRLMAEVEQMLAEANGQRILRELRSVEETRASTYLIDRFMSQILLVVIAALLFITAMGIVGLTVFNINRRRKQIGTRRALGATRTEILRYFLIENAMITAVGVTVGAVLSIAFNIFLVQNFNMPPIDWYYPPLGMLALILVGQLAVLGPSQGAARIAPAVATRSV